MNLTNFQLGPLYQPDQLQSVSAILPSCIVIKRKTAVRTFLPITFTPRDYVRVLQSRVAAVDFDLDVVASPGLAPNTVVVYSSPVCRSALILSVLREGWRNLIALVTPGAGAPPPPQAFQL
jgi:hypothetical protein